MNIEILKNRKKALKLTTAQLAYMAELPVSTVSKIMTGETKNPSFLTIETLEKTISKLEQNARMRAFVDAFLAYQEKHPDFSGSSLDFEPIYREELHLTASPIPFAVPIEKKEFYGDLALKRERGLSLSEYLDIETDAYTELIDGRIIFAQFPGIQHQRLVQSLGFYIQSFINDNDGKCQLFSVGVNLQLDEFDNTLLGPDIVVCCDEIQENEVGLVGTPDFIIEVTSPSTRKKDYREKLAKYIAAGVREYWVIDLQKEIVVVYLQGTPTMSYLYQFSEDIPVSIYDGKLKINVGELV